MTMKEIHWAFKQMADKVDSADNRNFLPNEIDYFINQAVLLVFNTLSPFYNKNQTITDILKVLDKEIIITSGFTANNNYTQSAYPEDYAKYLRARIKELQCTTPYQVIVTSQDDLNNSLQNEFQKPSSKWKRALLVFRNTNLCFYTESSLQSVELEYLKLPNTVCIGGYEDIEGNLTTTVELEYPNWAHDLVVDLAVLIAQGVMENDKGYQLIMNKIKYYYDSYIAS